jgi:tetratricopeptide (TPR) repeat protein
MRTALDRVAAGATIQSPAAVSAEARERLQALGYVGASADASTAPGDGLPDPKDKREILERYRAAVDLAGERKWRQAIALVQEILHDEPQMADLWAQLATFASRIDRFDQAVDAYKHYIALKPTEPQAYLGAAAAQLRLRKFADAREHAALAIEVAGEKDGRSRAQAHELLARVALAQKDFDTARAEAERAADADPSMPVTSYIEGRIQYDQGHYGDAMPSFEQAIGELRNPKARPIPELYYYAGDTLGRLERYNDAEVAFKEELKLYPLNARARAGLAMLYQATGRADVAEQAIRDMVRITPTQETYALAARLFTMFGRRQDADAVRADARRAFGTARPSAR